MPPSFKNRLIPTSACVSVLLAMLFFVCTGQRNNPLDAHNPDYIPPSITIDTSGVNIAKGDTVSVDSVKISVTGNRAESVFRARLDSIAWTQWDSSGEFRFDSIVPGKHIVIIESEYNGWDYVVCDTIAFFVRAKVFDTSKTFISFGFAGPATTGIIDTAAGTIAVNVPFGTDVTALVAVFSSSGSSVKITGVPQVSGVTADNFTNPVAYTVTAADNSTRDYIVTVYVAANNAKALTSFSFANPAATGIINEAVRTIEVIVPSGTDVTALAATFATTGASVKMGSVVQVSGTTPNSFASPVAYTVTAADSSMQDYVVTVRDAANPAKSLTSFGFASPSATGTISEAARTVAVTVPYGTSLTDLIATFVSAGVSVKVGSTMQVSGTTANNFSSPVTYTVTAADTSTQDYVVTVTVAANPAKALTSFGFASLAVVEIVNEAAKTVVVIVPYGTTVTALAATFASTGMSVKVDSITQVSGTTVNDFSSPVTYTVTSADTSTQNYVVTVRVADNPAKVLTAFGFANPAVAGTINESAKTVAVNVPYGTMVTALAATFTTTGASVEVGSTVQTSGTTVNNFSSPVTYIIRAADNSTQNYVVTVIVEGPKPVMLSAIPGVTAPVTGALQVSAVTANDQYTGTVSWSPDNNPFTVATIFTATITLTAKTGFTFSGVEGNFFTAAGATATNPANSGVVTAVFPATTPVPVTFTGLAQVGGVSNSVTTTALTLSFDVDPTTLTIGDIAVTGATKGTFSGTGLTRTLTISNITVANGATVSVAIANSSGFSITGSLRTAVVYKFRLTMVSVRAGTFQRDDTAGNTSTVSAFRMSEKEITRAQFLAIMGVDPSNISTSVGTSEPVQTINWYHAIAFCNKLSIVEGLTLVYSVAGVDFASLLYDNIPKASDANWEAVIAVRSNSGYRLPTEMEWMWAAMGATSGGVNVSTTGYNKAFAGSNSGNAIGDYAVFGYYGSETGRTTTARSNPVGSKVANELGLYDMSGNVWEWCWDRFDGSYYPAGALTDYSGSAAGTIRIHRGGSWDYDASSCGIASRNYNYAYRPYAFIGLRVVSP